MSSTTKVKEEVYKEEDEVYREEDEVYTEEEEVYKEEDEVYREEDEVYKEEDEVYTEEDEVYKEEDEVYKEEDEVYTEEDEVYKEEDEVYKEEDEVYTEEDEVFEVQHIPTLTQETLVRLSLPNEEDPTILLRVQSQKHADISYMTSPTLPLSHVLRDYCRRSFIDFETARFIFDEKRVQEGDTPEKHGMEDGDVIDALSDMLGGGGSGFSCMNVL